MTREEMDIRFDERRRRKEERESNKFSTSMKRRLSVTPSKSVALRTSLTTTGVKKIK